MLTLVVIKRVSTCFDVLNEGMPVGRNIAIFSDGTGQRGGVSSEETETNIFKMFRAARSGPTSSIDPSQQFAFYDPGIGTVPPGFGFSSSVWRWTYNLVCQATGFGLTRNIVDCYAEIIRNWREGDRIFLFGFSRGAYTARCVAAVIALCGVPTREKDGLPLRRDRPSVRRIAREAVTKVYQHVSSPQDGDYVAQRDLLAARFREAHGSGTGDGANAYPHFIGVFDTVASVASWSSLALVVGLVLIVWAILIAAFTLLFGDAMRWAGWVAGLSAVVTAIAYAKTHLKFATNLPNIPLWKTIHLTSVHMKFYDRRLNTNVGWARHALAIDEHRADFINVGWGSKGFWRNTNPGEPIWLEQVWFAGNHADIGGGYPEPESRLSDIALDWMVEAATSVPDGLHLDQSVLLRHPSPAGVQHDETRIGTFRFAKKALRSVGPKLHPSVAERVKLTAVVQYDVDVPYRPDNLQRHDLFDGPETMTVNPEAGTPKSQP